jgi:hypothetical protein
LSTPFQKKFLKVINKFKVKKIALMIAPLRTFLLIESSKPIELDTIKQGAESGEPTPQNAAAIAHINIVRYSTFRNFI